MYMYIIMVIMSYNTNVMYYYVHVYVCVLYTNVLYHYNYECIVLKVHVQSAVCMRVHVY